MSGVRSWNRFNWALLRQNALEFARRTGRTAYALHKEMGISDNLLKGFGRADDTWKPSMKTLERIEEFYELSPEWPMNDMFGGVWRASRGDDGSITRRLHDRFDNPIFERNLDLWRDYRSGRVPIDSFLGLKNTTIIEASTKNPDDFSFHSVSPQTAGVNQNDWTGRHLRDYRRPVYYMDAYFQDLIEVACRDTPTLSEIIWERSDIRTISYSMRLILPAPPFLLSCLWVSALETDIFAAFQKITRQQA